MDCAAELFAVNRIKASATQGVLLLASAENIEVGTHTPPYVFTPISAWPENPQRLQQSR
jgi:hypothetical protein